MWHRIQEILAGQEKPSWSYVTRVQSDSDEAVSKVRTQLSDQGKSLENQLSSETENIRQHLQPVVMFGIFLVAVTILSVGLSVITNGRDTPEVYVPSWVANKGWILLLATLSIATITTGVMGATMIWRLWKRK